MTSVVFDTHALIWYLLVDPRLSRAAGSASDAATDSGLNIYLPTICLVKATYLTEKKPIMEEALSRLGEVLAEENPPIQPFDLTPDVAKAVRKIPRSSIPDLPDRIIAAIALQLGSPLVTRDGKIRASGIETIWLRRDSR